MWPRLLLSAAIVVVPVVAACGSSPVAPTDPLPSQLASAPTHVTVDGKGLTLGAYVYVNLMPALPPGGPPLIAILTVRTDDGSAMPASVTADRTYAVRDAEVWSAPVEQKPRSATDPAFEVVGRNPAKWDANVIVDVVVRLTDSAGSSHLLRAPNQKIGAAY